MHLHGHVHLHGHTSLFLYVAPSLFSPRGFFVQIEADRSKPPGSIGGFTVASSFQVVIQGTAVVGKSLADWGDVSGRGGKTWTRSELLVYDSKHEPDRSRSSLNRTTSRLLFIY